ncbi:MAG: RNA-binding protein [Tannerellaceae bacterium]|nr:RNA-binding protein [Tannerellaceae bacterium]
MNIYVGNLHYGVRESDLKEIMEEYGNVSSAKLIMGRNTGRSKGFAFVEMDNDNEAKNAISSLNGASLEGRDMVVKEALPRN